MGYVQELKQVTRGTCKAVDPTYVRDNNDNLSSRRKLIPALLQKAEWVIDMLEYMIQVNQIGLRSVQVRLKIFERAVVDIPNATLSTRCDQFATVITAGNLMAFTLKDVECATSAASNFKNPASRFEVMFGDSEDFFTVAPLS